MTNKEFLRRCANINNSVYFDSFSEAFLRDTIKVHGDTSEWQWSYILTDCVTKEVALAVVKCQNAFYAIVENDYLVCEDIHAPILWLHNKNEKAKYRILRDFARAVVANSYVLDLPGTTVITSEDGNYTLIANERGVVYTDNGSLRIAVKDLNAALPIRRAVTPSLMRLKDCAELAMYRNDTEIGVHAPDTALYPLFLREKERSVFLCDDICPADFGEEGKNYGALFFMAMGACYAVPLAYSVSEYGITDDLALFFVLLNYIVTGKRLNPLDGVSAQCCASDVAGDLLAENGHLAKKLKVYGAIGGNWEEE